MSTFLNDPPAVTYKFLVNWSSPSSRYGLPNTTLEFTHLRRNGFSAWTLNSRNAMAECRVSDAVEPLVRAWFLGDCIPGIVADFVEERGEGEEWLLRLLRDDPEWHASLPTPIRGQTADTIIIDDPVADVVPDPEQARRMREWYEEYRRRLAERLDRETDATAWRLVMLPTVDWTYRPNDRVRWVTNPQDRTVGGPVVVSGTT